MCRTEAIGESLAKQADRVLVEVKPSVDELKRQETPFKELHLNASCCLLLSRLCGACKSSHAPLCCMIEARQCNGRGVPKSFVRLPWVVLGVDLSHADHLCIPKAASHEDGLSMFLHRGRF